MSIGEELKPKLEALGHRKFIESEDSYLVWTRNTCDNTLSRGIPGKVPYQVGREPFLLLQSTRNYWEHYGYDPFAPLLDLDAL